MADQTGLIPFQDGVIPTIVVNSLGAPYTVPISLFPEFVNDAGQQTFGGAKYVSCFDNGLGEGASGNVTGVNQSLISAWGGITVPSPAADTLYNVRIRLRAALNDATYIDRVVSFRFVTPLSVPVDISRYAEAEEPLIQHVGGQYQFVDAGGGIPAGEIVMQNGRGGIILPNVTLANWSSEAQDFLNERASRLRRTLITIDFAPAGSIESYMQLTYLVTFDDAGQAVFTRYRRRDFSTWGYFSGNTMDFVEAAIDMTTSTASLTFLRGLYAMNPRFDGVWAVGSKGSMIVNPSLVETGGQIDVSAVIDFDAKSHLTQTGLTDKFLLLITQTQTQMLVTELPLRPQGYFDFVGADGVTNYYAATIGSTLPAVSPLFCRWLFYPYIEFPNFTSYYDPAAGFLPGPNPASAQAPQIQNIEIYVDGAGVAAQTYADVVAMHNSMRTVAMPTIGTERHVLDVRGFTTPIPSSASYLRINMEVNDGTNPAYAIDCYYELNGDGQPNSWKLPPALTGAVAPDAPQMEYNPATRTLTLQNPASTAITAAGTLRGDLGEVAVVLNTAGSGVTTLTSTMVDLVLSPLGELLELEFTNASGVFKRRVGTLSRTTDLIQPTSAGAPISVWFTGGSLVLGDISAVDTNAGGFRELTLAGEGPSMVIRDAQSNTVEFLNTQQGGTLGQFMRQTHIDVFYEVSSVLHQLRVYNNFFDSRSASPRTLSIQPRPAWGATGTDYDNFNFSAPRMLFDLAAKTITIEGDGRVWNFRSWRFHNLTNDEAIDFSGPPTQGREYHVGAVLRDALAGQKLLFVAQHRNGAQKAFTVEIRPASGGYVTPEAATLNPNL